jgi:hypothetical protein
MFRALLAHLQEALQKRRLVYCVCVMSVGCTRIVVELVPPNHGASLTQSFLLIVSVTVGGSTGTVPGSNFDFGIGRPAFGRRFFVN